MFWKKTDTIFSLAVPENIYFDISHFHRNCLERRLSLLQYTPAELENDVLFSFYGDVTYQNICFPTWGVQIWRQCLSRLLLQPTEFFWTLCFRAGIYSRQCPWLCGILKCNMFWKIEQPNDMMVFLQDASGISPSQGPIYRDIRYSYRCLLLCGQRSGSIIIFIYNNLFEIFTIEDILY